MSVELWLGIGHYLLGVLVIFALVVALMETSRKFDRFHDNSYLLLATGYFLLVVWALIRAIAIGASMLQMIAVICLVIGLLCLAFGYYFHHQAHPNENEDDSQSPSTAPSKKTDKIHLKEDWMNMLSANEEPPEPVAEPEAESMVDAEPGSDAETKSEVKDAAEEIIKEESAPEPVNKPVVEPKIEKKTKPAKVTEPPAEVDLSYLSSRSKKVKEVKPAVAEPAPVSEPVAETPIEPAPIPPATVPKASKKKAVKKELKAEVKESREEIMDDLFPLAHESTKKSKNKISAQSETDILPGEGVHDAK